MNYRRLGSAGIKVSEIALGGWTTFGESIQDPNLARQLIMTAYENGINFFDIADAYADGDSERMMGAVLKKLPRHTLVISSKLYWPMSDDVNDRGRSRKHIMGSIEGSLRRIGTDYLDIFYRHRYETETPAEETVRAMDDLVHQGKILYWGTSEWRGAQIAAAVGLARQYNLYQPQVEQPGYNLFRHERVESEILPVTESHGIGLTTFSPLASGLLTGKYDEGVPEDSRMARNERMRERFTDEARERVRRLKPIADELGITRAQLALAWILSHSGVSSVITGATKVSHIEANVKATDVALKEDVLSQIEAIFSID